MRAWGLCVFYEESLWPLWLTTLCHGKAPWWATPFFARPKNGGRNALRDSRSDSRTTFSTGFPDLSPTTQRGENSSLETPLCRRNVFRRGRWLRSEASPFDPWVLQRVGGEGTTNPRTPALCGGVKGAPQKPKKVQCGGTPEKLPKTGKNSTAMRKDSLFI